MQQDFLNLFQELKIEEPLRPILSQTKVERISTNPDHSAVRIYISSQTLIPKRRIWKLEEAIRSRYFHTQPATKVHIIERFCLTGYTPEHLYENYKDSILEEIHRYSAVLFQVLAKSTLTFGEGKLDVSLEDSIIARSAQKELCEVLDKIFCERCGLPLIIDISYHKAEAGKYRKQEEERINQKILAIIHAAARAGEQDKAAEEENASSNCAGKNAFRKKNADKNAAYGKENASSS